MEQEQQKYTITLTADQLEALPKEILVQLLTGATQPKPPRIRRRVNAQNAGLAWEAKDIAILWSLWRQGKTNAEIAEQMGRSKQAIENQISKLRKRDSE